MNRYKTKRKTRSDKFPLTLHSIGQYCKKIKGKIHYFGKDKKQAWERYLEQAAFLYNGKAKMFKTTNSNMTLKSLFIAFQGQKPHLMLLAIADFRHLYRHQIK